MRRAAAHLAFALGWTLGPLWLAAQRTRYRRIARPLLDSERRWVAGHVEPHVLDTVSIARVKSLRIAPAFIPGVIRPRAVALGRLVVMTEPPPAKDDDRSVLFHELIHVLQHERFGPAAFCGRYLRGFIATGRYRAIPFEQQAYQLQSRFDRSADVFSARDAVWNS